MLIIFFKRFVEIYLISAGSSTIDAQDNTFLGFMYNLTMLVTFHYSSALPIYYSVRNILLIILLKYLD